ncbi:hypothetical protein Tco_1395104 [Tanacetum coccineum]
MPSPSGSGTAKSGYARQSEVSVLSLANKQHKSTHIVFNAVIGCNWDRFGSAKSAQSSDEESTLANNRFTKANEYHVVPPPITGNPLTPRADISFAGLDEYAFRNKIIESKTTETNKTVGTDKAKITRKRSKPDKHGHGKRRAQKEPEMDVESAFLYGTIEEDVHQPPGFVDPAHPNKVYKARHHMFNVLCRNFTNVQDSGLCRSQFDRKSTTGGCQFLGMKTHILGIVQYKKLGQIMQISLLLRQNMISMDLRMDRSCAANSSYSWSKPNESVGFTKVVDFLKGISLRYALTHNPTIYDPLVKQFCQTATVRTLANGTQQLIASIDSTEYNITEASVRTEPHHTPVDPLPSTSLPPIQSPPHSPIQSPPHSPHQSPPHSPIQSPPHSPHQSIPHSPHQSPPYSLPHYSPPRSYEAPLPEGNTSGSAEDSMQLKELMDIIPQLVTRIETLETELQQTKTTYGKAVLTLVKRVKILEKALKRKTQKVVISESEGEELEDQGRII